MKHCFIINPVSGGGKRCHEFIDQINATCKRLGVDYEINITEHRGYAERIVREKAKETDGDVRFYACGGDGTFHEVANGAVGFDNVQIAMIPIGTGNDFPRSFDTTGDFLSVEDQVRGEAKAIDVVKFNDRYFMNTMNIGFDSSVVSTIAKLRKKHKIMSGKFAYIIGVIINLVKMPCATIKASFENETFEGRFLLTAIGNGQYCGGGFKATSKAILDDGKMDVVMVKPVSRLKFVSLVGKYKDGTILDDKKAEKIITFKQCEKVNLHFDRETEFCVDGEILYSDNIDIEVIHNAVKFSVPRKA